MIHLSPGVTTREIDLSTTIPAVPTSIGAIAGGFKKGPVLERTLVTNQRDLIAKFGEPYSNSYAAYTALKFLEKGKQLYVVRAINSALYGGIDIETTGSDSTSSPFTTGRSDATAVTDATVSFTIYAANPGVWNNNIGVTVITSASYMPSTMRSQLAATYEPDSTAVFLIGVYDTVLAAWVETFAVSRNTNKRDENNRSMYLETVINGVSDYIVVKDNTTTEHGVMPKSMTIDTTDAHYMTFTAGSDGTLALTAGQVQTAYEKFRNPEDVDVNIIMSAGWHADAVLNTIISICEQRKDCLGVLDAPYAQGTPDGVINWKRNTWNPNSSYAAVYWPWVKVYDRYTDAEIYLPPSGFVGGIYAYTDEQRDPWWAPAGLNRGIITAYEAQYKPSKGERDLLYLNNINCIATFPGEGKVVWGQKTLQSKPSALDRVNVRRMLLVIERAMAIASRYMLFEPNDSFTRNLFVGMIEPYLRDVKSRRGLYDYNVVCDDSNNTAEVIDRNELIVDVYLKPTKAVEFITLNFIITKTGADFDELIELGGPI